MPQLSIIVPVYKVEQTLDECVGSIVRQTFTDWELILVDDGSPDLCGEMCNKWAQRDNRIRVIHKKNGGLSDARNAGIDVATSPFITFVDSDDFLRDDTFQEVLRLFDRYDACDIVEYPILERYGSSAESLLTFQEKCYERAIDYWYSEEAYRHCFACNKIYRRNLFEDTRYPIGRLYEDILTLPQLLMKARSVIVCNQGLYYYRFNPVSITGTPRYSNIYQLLNAHLESVRMMSANLHSGQTCRQYLTILNVQLDVYRFAPHTSANLIRIPFRRLPLTVAKNKKELLKILLLNTMGLKMLCQLYRLLRNRNYTK